MCCAPSAPSAAASRPATAIDGISTKTPLRAVSPASAHGLPIPGAKLADSGNAPPPPSTTAGGGSRAGGGGAMGALFAGSPGLLEAGYLLNDGLGAVRTAFEQAVGSLAAEKEQLQEALEAERARYRELTTQLASTSPAVPATSNNLLAGTLPERSARSLDAMSLPSGSGKCANQTSLPAIEVTSTST